MGGERVTLRSLESKARVKLGEGDWVFVLGKWEHERTKTVQVCKCVAREIDTAPDSLKKAWFDQYSDPLVESHLTVTRESLDQQGETPPYRNSIGIGEEEDKDGQIDLKISHGEFVKLTEKEYRNLCSDYTKEVIDKKIEHMNDYIGEDPKRVKTYKTRDHNRTIRNWLNRDGAKKTNSSDKKPYVCQCTECKKKYTSMVKQCTVATCYSWDIVKL